MTTEVTNEPGPQQVGEVDEATRAAALAEGISMPPVEGEEQPDVVNENPETNEGGAPERPEWLPEKFKTVEEMAAAYKALEQKQGNTEQQPQAQSNETPPDTAAGKQAADIVQKAGLDWSKLNTEWQAEGKLSDASYEAFAKQGVSKELVDGFITGQQAVNAQAVNVMRNAAFETAGGEAKYMEAISWAKTGMDAKAIAAFDKVVTGNDPAAVKIAVQGLMAAYSKAGGAEPVNIATTSKAGQGSTYANMDQVVADMSNPKYESDASFRKSVADKIARSQNL